MKDLKEHRYNMFTAQKDVVNVNQLAEMLSIGITLAYRLVKQNTIKSIKVGRQYKIPKQNIISYLLSQNVVQAKFYIYYKKINSKLIQSVTSERSL